MRRRPAKETGPGGGDAPKPAGVRTPPAEAAKDSDVVRAMYRALAEGDTGSLAGHADPEIEWVDPLVTRLPFDGTRRGLAAVLRVAFRRGADGTGPRISAETFLELGDGVLVAGRFLGCRGDEAEESPFLHEACVRGDRVVRIREYPAESG